MAYRDDHEAALHRVDALERELAKTKAKLAAAEEAQQDPPEEPADEPPPPPPVAPVAPVAPIPSDHADRSAHGVTVRSDGGQLTLRWRGWGAGNFVSFMVLYGPPVATVGLVAIWFSRGMPPIPFERLPLPWFILGCVVGLWSTAALVCNRGNRIVVGPSTVTVQQGVIPWLVSYRRWSVSRSEIVGFDLDSFDVGEDGGTMYRVRAQRTSGRTRMTNALDSEAQAKLILDELERTLRR